MYRASIISKIKNGVHTQILNRITLEFNISNDFIFACHLLFASILFSNFFLFGHILVPGTDAITLDFPMLILAKRNFLEGTWGLWNPYLLSGIPSFAFAKFNILMPHNWPLFFVPEKYFFIAFTFSIFIFQWLIGVFSFKLFLEEIGDRKWSFFASTVLQLSGYTTSWALSLNVIPLIFFMLLSLFAVWSFNKRPTYLNFIYLTITFILVLYCDNIAYCLYSIILICGLAVYRHLSYERKPFSYKPILVFVLAMAVSLLVFMVRFLPMWGELGSSSHGYSFNPDLLDYSFWGLRFFFPEIFGINFMNSHGILNTISPIHANHIHGQTPQFYGVLPALLFLWVLCSPQKGKITFWLIYVIISISIICYVEPFDTILRVLAGSMYHPGVNVIFLGIGFSILSGYAGKYFEKDLTSSKPDQKTIIMFLFLIVTGFLFSVSTGLIYFRAKYLLLRPILTLFFVFSFLLFLVCRTFPDKIAMIFKKVTGPVIFISILALFYISLFYTSANTTFLYFTKLLAHSFIGLLFLFYFTIAKCFQKERSVVLNPLVAVLLIIISAMVTLYPWAACLREYLGNTEDLLLAFGSIVRYLLITAIFLTILYSLIRGNLKPGYIFPLFMGILLFDMLNTSKIHSHVVLNPFYRYSTIYSQRNDVFKDENGKPFTIDKKNYRVNYPNRMLDIPIVGEAFGRFSEPNTSCNINYGIRSYGGYYNVVPATYIKFITRLANEDLEGKYSGHGINTTINNSQRLLDLLGVGYDYDTSKRIVVKRPFALSRFMLFKSFEVLNGEESLVRLKTPNFNPLKTVVLGEYPGFPNNNLSDYYAVPEEYEAQSTDLIKVKISSDSNAILMFNDSYHSGWQAYVNGKKQKIYNANNNFMAIAVQPGESDVTFHFNPKYFYLGLKFGFLGVLFFLLIGVALFKFQKEQKKIFAPENEV